MATDSVLNSHRRLQRWHSAVELINSLHLLCLDVRNHRGASSAFLAGDTFFKSMTISYSKKIKQHIFTLINTQSLFEQFDCEEDFQVMLEKWHAIQKSFRIKPQLIYFDMHCDLLKEIQLLIWLITISADKQLIDDSEKSLIANFLFKSHTDAMESVARLRGYACMFCANETISKDQQRLMSDEIKRAFVCWQKRQDDFSELPIYFYKQLQQQKSQSHLTSELIELVTIVSPMQSNNPMPNASEVFNMASSLLNHLNGHYLQGLQTLRIIMPEELSAWINEAFESSQDNYSADFGILRK